MNKWNADDEIRIAYSKRVNAIAEKAHALILTETEDMAHKPTSRWLIFGRVVTLVFNNHFHVGFVVAENKMAEKVRAGEAVADE